MGLLEQAGLDGAGAIAVKQSGVEEAVEEVNARDQVFADLAVANPERSNSKFQRH